MVHRSLSSNEEKSHTEDICIHYRTKGKSQLQIKVNGEVVDNMEITDVKISDSLSDLGVINDKGGRLIYRFHKKENKLETIILLDDFMVIETGQGLSYRISRRIKGTGGVQE